MLELVVAMAVTFASAPVARRLAIGGGILDTPNSRSSHTIPTPRTGGLACAAGVLVAVLLATALSHDVAWLAVGAACILGAVGFIDDVTSLSPILRLGIQAVVGILLGLGLGGWPWLLIGALAVPAVVNVVNFMDGVNGITSLTMTCWGVTALIAGAAADLGELSMVGAVVAGSAVGFLPWNVPVARLFLGDSGSYMFGGLVAGGILYGWYGGAPLLVLVAPLWLYLTDTGVTLLRRLRHGDSLMGAHRTHVYQRLVADGLPHWLVAVVVAVASAFVTVSWAFWAPATAAAVGLAVSVVYLTSPAIVVRLTSVGRQSRTGV